MLSHIYIKNFGLIREADMDLAKGLNIISGETGTGKSMVIQAVNVALGGRGSASMIAGGASKALVQLVFTLSAEESPEFERYLSGEDEREIILTRQISRSGRSLARINGEIVKVSELAEAAKKLADIHGQYDNQFFLDTGRHLEILDTFASDAVAPLRERLSEAYRDYQEKRSRLVKLRRDRSEILREQDFMRYELQEIESANVRDGEDEELQERINILSNAEKIYDTLNRCYETIYNSGIDTCVSLLSGISGLSEKYGGLYSQLSECAYTLEDLQNEFREARDQAEVTPGELDEAMTRMDVLESLKRKYGGTLAGVLARRDECRRALELSENSDELDRELSAEYKKARATALKLAAELSAKRREAAAELEKAMNAELSELNFSNARFSVYFSEHRNKKGQLQLTPSGTDQVEFLFSANKGAPLRPLAEIASGGEISRISLAFKCVTSESEQTGTMIFDEIDTGISGRTASVVASKMRRIARRHQIICITHLPQIAAAGDVQFLISKEEDSDSNYTTITPLSHEERVAEIARLLGGTTITETTLKSAAELIEASQT